MVAGTMTISKSASHARRLTGAAFGAIGLAALVAAGSASAPATARSAVSCPATGFIDKMGKELFSAARSGSKRSFKRVLARYADTPKISRFALGRYRKSLPGSHARNYHNLVKDFVARLMAENAVQFQGQRFEITRCPQKNRSVAVTGRLHSKKRGVRPVVLRLTRSGGGFRIQDVNVHGVWLGVQLRSKFTSVLKRNKGDIRRLYEFLAPERKELPPAGGR